MPLMKSRSKAAFKENVSRELAAGKPLKQSLAIAYSIKEPKMKTASARKPVATASIKPDTKKAESKTTTPLATEIKAKMETHKQMMEHHKGKMEHFKAKMTKGKK